MTDKSGVVREPPPELKSIKQFVQRGNQLRTVEPVIAYYCYFWSIKQILANNLHQASTACTAWTADLMDELEKRKEELKDKDIINDDIAAQAYVENFALKVFENGAKVVTAGKATSTTQDTLLAAACFLELVKIFAEPDAEIQQKIKFAKFHAARIWKAINLGQDPNPSTPERVGTPEAQSSRPPPPTVEEEAEVPSSFRSPPSAPMISRRAPQESGQAPSPPLPPEEQGPSRFYYSGSPSNPTPPPPPRPMSQAPPPAVPQIHTPDTSNEYFPPVPIVHEPSAPSLSPSTMSAANMGFPEMHTQRPLATHYQPIAPPSTPQGYNYNANQPTNYYSQPPAPVQQLPVPTPSQPVMRKHEPTEEDILRAQKHAKWAISALDYEDVETAIKEFRLGLERLGAL
ncbi:DUF605-domain-containing protein [Choiromyces venosus 120613-1]|uniref:DUF605-domain-containing protein n=1 Tax=Choiromyces venosus 120613-1 TaxID=1336337 RepID=A0A3N4JD34_9PEZI|nr:DUF605-domain-containing protein [Choiromyces venosus 120613-1]